MGCVNDGKDGCCNDCVSDCNDCNGRTEADCCCNDACNAPCGFSRKAVADFAFFATFPSLVSSSLGRARFPFFRFPPRTGDGDEDVLLSVTTMCT